MPFKYRSKISFLSFVLNCVVFGGFFYLVSNPGDFKNIPEFDGVQAYTSRLSSLKEEIPDGSTINVNNIYIDDNLSGVVYYIVQKGDTLSKIATNFGSTVAHIKKVNNLRSDVIRPGQKLSMTEEEGFVYISKGETASELAKKFNINKQDILEANGLPTNDFEFRKQDEVFIPMSDEDYKKYFNQVKHKSLINQTQLVKPIASTRPSNSNTTSKSNTTRSTSSTSSGPRYTYNGGTVVSQYWRKPDISNGFYRGQCTRFVAIKKFPYIDGHTQRKLRNGNANHWYYNAKAAGYSVGQTPKVGSIVVIRVGGARYYYAGHVAIVRQIDRNNRKLLVEEMNAKGKYVVTKRWISMDYNIVGYIYL